MQLNDDGTIGTSSAASGVDTLKDIERIETTDGTLAFDITSDNTEYVYRIYDAAFGRTPDESGLIFWNNQINIGNENRDSLAEAFVVSPEFDILFPSSSDEAFVVALYQNALRRAPDDTGQKFWIDAFATGELSRTDMLVEFADSPENIARNAENYDDGVWVL